MELVSDGNFDAVQMYSFLRSNTSVYLWIMASGPITSWEIDGETVETVETVSDFIFVGSKITADGDCSHEIKRCLLLGRKVMKHTLQKKQTFAQRKNIL